MGITSWSKLSISDITTMMISGDAVTALGGWTGIWDTLRTEQGNKIIPLVTKVLVKNARRELDRNKLAGILRRLISYNTEKSSLWQRLGYYPEEYKFTKQLILEYLEDNPDLFVSDDDIPQEP